MDELEQGLKSVKIWAHNSKKQKSYDIFKQNVFFEKNVFLYPVWVYITALKIK